MLVLSAGAEGERRLDELCRELAQRDDRLGWLHQTQGTPPLWSRPPGFATLVQIILEQQVSLSSAAAIYQRLQHQLGGEITPASVRLGGEPALREAGLTRQKTTYCLGLADATLNGLIDFEALTALPDAQVRDQLTQLKGIGPWTANIYLLMGLGRADIWPRGDLALNTAARHLHGWTSRKTDAGIAGHARRWKPYRSVAARLLWQHYLNRLPVD